MITRPGVAKRTLGVSYQKTETLKGFDKRVRRHAPLNGSETVSRCESFLENIDSHAGNMVLESMSATYGIEM
ncbi:MAG: hypothetical protein ACE5IY_15345 [bacterium]